MLQRLGKYWRKEDNYYSINSKNWPKTGDKPVTINNGTYVTGFWPEFVHSIFCVTKKHIQQYEKNSFVVLAMPVSHTKNAFQSSIFHLSTIIILIISRMTLWKIAFSARLSSTLIFHLPPTVSGGKSSVKNWYTNTSSAFPKQICLIKYFVFPYYLVGNGAIFTPTRNPGPMTPRACPRQPAYPGWRARVRGTR